MQSRNHEQFVTDPPKDGLAIVRDSNSLGNNLLERGMESRADTTQL